MSAKHKESSRRDFLKKLLKLGTGGAFAAAASTVATAHADTPSGTGGRMSQGYRLTPHIKTYYDKAGA